jgi:hypothetical protein
MSLAHVGQRPNHHVRPSSLRSFGGMPDSGVVEQVHEERGHHVVAVVAQRDLGEAVLGGMPYSAPRRRREHSEHMVLPSGMTRLTTE